MNLASIFRDNMVFQAEKPVRFFGTGSGNVEIVLKGSSYAQSFSGETWGMELPAQPYGGVFDITVRLQGEIVLLKNVAFGDVFLCAGQSNMRFAIKEEKGASNVRTDEKIRYFCSDRIEEHDSVKSADGWLLCKEKEIGCWSALGTHIAVEYRKKKDVFVGIIGCFQGASVIRSWIPERELDEDVYVPLEYRLADHVHPIFGAWNGDSQLYQHTFLPIVPFAVKDVVWYQGESDTTIAEGRVYTKLLAKLIKAWREDLRDKELPFVVVEICDCDSRNDEGWRSIQQCQQAISGVVKNVTTVTSKDVCEHFDIHPANKEELARKIAYVL